MLIDKVYLEVHTEDSLEFRSVRLSIRISGGEVKVLVRCRCLALNMSSDLITTPDRGYAACALIDLVVHSPSFESSS